MTRIGIARACIVVAAVAGSAPISSGDSEALPYTLAIRVEYGEPTGPTSVSDEVERLTLHHIESRMWFEDARVLEGSGPPETDLFLQVVLDEYEEETIYETSMAGRLEADDPLARRRYHAIFSVIVRMRLIHVPDGVTLRTRRFRVQYSRAPEYTDEALEDALRADAVREIAQGIRRATAKGNLEKLGRKIESLRAAPSNASR
jgi:hypothetical protein